MSNFVHLLFGAEQAAYIVFIWVYLLKSAAAGYGLHESGETEPDSSCVL